MSCTEIKWAKSRSRVRSKKENQTGCNFADLPGIPMAPVKVSMSNCCGFSRKGRGVDNWWTQQKAKLSHRLPLLEQNDLTMHKMSYPTFVIYNLVQEGHSEPAAELTQILKKELKERSRGKYINGSGISDKVNGPAPGHFFVTLVSKPPDIVDHLVDHLKLIEEEKLNGHYEAITLMRKELGEKFLRSRDFWLSKHFLLSALKASQRLFVSPFITTTREEVDEQTKSRATRIQAEIHCLLAYMARHNIDNLEKALESAVRHLNYCRILSKDKSWWQVSPGNILIRIKSPIALHGLRDDFQVIDGSSMNLYTLATLLEHELLMSLANQSLQHHKVKFQQDTHHWADKALKLAIEVGHPGALASALVKFGEVLRHSGKFKEALEYLEYLKDHSGLTGDFITECIAYHNFALCHISLGNNLLGLEFLVKQWELSMTKGYLDLEADAVQELGFICLLEGQGWESEYCYSFAHQRFRYLEKLNYHNNQSSNGGGLYYGDKSTECTSEEDKKKNKLKSQIAQTIAKNCDLFWALSGIASGLTFTSKMTGLVRAGEKDHIDAINDWKRSRYCLPFVPTPDYEPDLIKNDGGTSSLKEIDRFYAASGYTSDAEDDDSASVVKTAGQNDESFSNNSTQPLTESNDTTTNTSKTKSETDGKEDSQLISEITTTSTSNDSKKLQTSQTPESTTVSVSVDKSGNLDNSDKMEKKKDVGSSKSKGVGNGNKSDNTTASKTNESSSKRSRSRTRSSLKSKSRSRKTSGRSKLIYHKISQVDGANDENENDDEKSTCSTISSIKEEHVVYDKDFEYQSDTNALKELRRYRKIIEAMKTVTLEIGPHQNQRNSLRPGKASLKRGFSLGPRPSSLSISSFHMKLKPFILSQVFANSLKISKKKESLLTSERI